MCKLPFYKMYPSDAEMDANFRLLDDAELGFYWRCLNHAWVNGGLPADPEDRARMLRTPRETADRYWLRVGRCFVANADGTMIVNPRQEREREDALVSSERARHKAQQRWGKEPSDAAAMLQHMPEVNSASPRASDSESSSPSVSVSSSTNTPEEDTVRSARAMVPYQPDVTWLTDERYQGFATVAREFWQDLMDSDLRGWYPQWKALGVENQLLAQRRVRERIEVGQTFIKVYKFTYFTSGEWERKAFPNMGNAIPFPVKESATDRAIRIGHERIQKYGHL